MRFIRDHQTVLGGRLRGLPLALKMPLPDVYRIPYPKDVLTRQPTHQINRIEELLPHLWQQEAA